MTQHSVKITCMYCIMMSQHKNETPNPPSSSRVGVSFNRSHMGQYQLLSVLSARLSPLNIDNSRNLPVEISGINYTEKYTKL